MNLCEAVKTAVEQNAYISRPELIGSVKIKPTDSPRNCIAMLWDGSYPTKNGWNPCARDFLRDDWLVIPV